MYIMEKGSDLAPPLSSYEDICIMIDCTDSLRVRLLVYIIYYMYIS